MKANCCNIKPIGIGKCKPFYPRPVTYKMDFFGNVTDEFNNFIGKGIYFNGKLTIYNQTK